MKKNILCLTLILAVITLKAQKVDSIFFHLYTDSLKKGTYNYINVDAKMSDGRWKPLTAKEIEFSSTQCKFSGNELIIPENFKDDRVAIKAVLKSNPSIYIERIVWIKKKPDPDVLPTKDEILKGKSKSKNLTQ